MDSVLPKGVNLADGIKLATIAHRYAPSGTSDRIYAQNYLLERGFSDLVDVNNEQLRTRIQYMNDSLEFQKWYFGSSKPSLRKDGSYAIRDARIAWSGWKAACQTIKPTELQPKGSGE